MNRKISVLAVSHSCLVAENHKLWECLAKDSEFQLTMLVPPRFRATLREHRLEKTDDPNYRIESARTFLAGNRFGNHLHFYREKIGQVLRDVPPDIVFVQEEPWSLSMQQVALLRNKRSRVIFYTAQNQIKRYPFPFNVLRRNALRVSDAAVAICEEARDVLQHQGFTKPICLLPLGVDTDAFTASEERRRHWRRKLALDGFVVGYVGRLTAAKGIFDLLEVIARLGRDFRLMMIGDGPDKKMFLRRADELGVSGQLAMVGVIPHSDMPDLMPAMDVMVLPSHTTHAWKEQFGRVLIEAMSCGVPVVGSGSGEIPTTIGEAGLVFPEKNQPALADALMRLCSSAELRDSLIKKGVKRARQFDWDVIASQLGDIFRDVLKARKSPFGLLSAA